MSLRSQPSSLFPNYTRASFTCASRAPNCLALPFALGTVALSAHPVDSRRVLASHRAPASLQVMEDSLSGARRGYVKVKGTDTEEEEQFVGPPCKRPRRAVDAPQVQAERTCNSLMPSNSLRSSIMHESGVHVLYNRVCPVVEDAGRGVGAG